jgi:hypothetical protein
MNASGYRWLADFLPVDEQGQPLLDIGFYVTLFFEDGHLVERRRAAYEILKEYWFRVGAHLRFTTNLKTHEWELVTGASLRQRVARGPAERAVEVERHPPRR